MKSLIVALVLSSSPAFADTTEIVKTTAMVDAHELNCVVRAGQDGALQQRLVTLLGQPRIERSVLRIAGLLELNHNVASARGCDLEKLDIIAKRAMNSFGFIHGAPVEVKKTTGAPRRAPNGRCIANVRELVTIDLGEGVTVVSEKGEMRDRDAQDCN